VIASSSSKKLSEEELQQLTESFAEKLIVRLGAADSEQRWLQKVSQSGTAADKAAAMKVMIQRCPPLGLKSIKSLFQMAASKGRSEALLAIENLQTLFLETLIPTERKLKAMNLSKEAPSATHIPSQILIYFEDALKLSYGGYVDILIQKCNDNVDFMKAKCVKHLAVLLAELPEQEGVILQALVNKLGDTALSASASQYLLQVLVKHPTMKGIFVKEIIAFSHRPQNTTHAKYKSLVLLSEIPWHRDHDTAVCRTVCDFVTKFLETFFNKKENQEKKKKQWKKSHDPHEIAEEDNRLVRAGVTTLHRALEHVGPDFIVSEEMVDTLFRVCHTVPAFATRIAILRLLLSIVLRSPSQQYFDRFFKLLYTQLTEMDLFDARNDNLIFHLVRQAIAEDTDRERCIAVVRRLCQLGASQGEPGPAYGSIWTFSDLLLARKLELQRILRAKNETALAPEIEEYADDDAAPKKETILAGYDPSKNIRDPRHAGANRTRIWEVWATKHHIHPIVSSSAKKVLRADTFTVEGEDAFETCSMHKFLDLFQVVNQSAEKSGEYLDLAKKVVPEEEYHAQYFRDMKISNRRKKLEARRRMGEEGAFGSAEGKDAEGGQEDDEQDVDAFFTKYLENQMSEQMGDPDMDDEPDMDDDEEDDEGSEDDEKAIEAALAEGDSDEDDADDSDGDDLEDDVDMDDDAIMDMEDDIKDNKPDHSSFKKCSKEDKAKRQKALLSHYNKSKGGLFASADDFSSIVGDDLEDVSDEDIDFNEEDMEDDDDDEE